MTSISEYGYNNTIQWVSPSDIAEFPEADEIGSVGPLVMRNENWHDSDALMMVVLRNVKANERWGDDSIIDESNYRSLVRDFPYAFVNVGYTNCDGLATFAHILDHDHELRKVVVGLADEYPIYDESDHSELVQERQEESWEAYVWQDLSSDIKNAMDKRFNNIGDDEEWNRIDDWVDDAEDMIRELFFESAYDQGWEFDDHGEWGRWSDIWQFMAQKVGDKYESR
ncbi:MAG TPA: hypothetical protein VHK27_05010 [Gammaproteobacteria bacterium]|nr:hypothetical protein [Gammaproteobacteria bacterium]